MTERQRDHIAPGRARTLPRWLAIGVCSLVGFGAFATILWAAARYWVSSAMDVAVREYSNAEYPEDPADRSVHFGQYDGRSLTIERVDRTHFNFVLKSRHRHVAQIAFRNVDVGLFTTGLPVWARDDAGLRRIALTDREWNRQQVRFDAGSAELDVLGGDGFEPANLHTAELAKNCLNAGLWEVLLFVREGDKKALYYQGWFTFPLGYYKDVFELNTGLPYWRHWYYLEHWVDPAGTLLPLARLRRVVAEREVPATFDHRESVLVAGEQVRKRRTTMATNVLTWGDFFDGRSIGFASFIPPGRYSVSRPWGNGYSRMSRFEKAVLREIVSPASERPLHELELVFSAPGRPGIVRFIVSGFDVAALPRLPVMEYARGLYMPMGIGVPPFFQSYGELREQPPDRSPYFGLLLDADDAWIDHHSWAIDGPVMHRDERDPGLLHVYLLSYERHSLVGHIVVTTR